MRRGYEPPRLSDGRRAQGALVTASARSALQVRNMSLELGCFFQDLRHTLALSQTQVAKRIATRIDVIAALETGHMRALPPWPETCRIVRTYTGFAGLDPRPVLRSIEMLLAVEARASAPEPRRMPPRIALPRSDKLMLPAPATDTGRWAASATTNGRSAELANGFAARLKDFWEGRIAQTGRALFAVTVPVALVVLITQTSVLEAAVSQLPPSVARIVRGAQNYVIVQLAPVRDGLRWIDVPDPRTRRSDKLRTASQSD